MIKLSIVFLLTLFAITGISQEINIVPQPSHVEFQKGVFRPGQNIYYKIYGIESDFVKTGIQQLEEEFLNDVGVLLKRGKPAQIKIGIPQNSKEFTKLCARNSLLKDDDLGSQGYVLKITKHQILLAANTSQGLFYGIQSLKQLLRGAQQNEIPCLYIHDVPVLKYRGVMDDISRGPVPTKEFMKYQIRRLAELKINLFSFYIEHVVKTEKYPEFAPANGAISIQEWEELSEYAADYHVQLVGSFQSLGHFEHILSHPKFKHLGASSRMLSPNSSESIEFLTDIYSEMAPAFSSDFFNINCDETWDLGRGTTKTLVDSLGIARVYANHINSLYQALKKQGKKMMMWGDIALAHPEIFEIIPKETIIMTWDYSDYDSFAGFIDPIVKNGFDFMICPGVLNSNRLFPDMRSALNNNRKFIAEGVEKGAMGVLNTVWDDGGIHSFNRDWYGVAYGAEQAWNSGDRSIDTFNKNLSKGIYGDKSDAYFKSIHQIMELYDLRATQELNSQVFWNTMIPERGKKISFNMSDWEEVLHITRKADSLLSLAEFSYYTDEPQFTRFVINQYQYLAEGRVKLLEAAYSYSRASQIQFQSPGEAKKLLGKANILIADCARDFSNLRNEVGYLWDKENRKYWKNYALDPYKKVLSDYDDLNESFKLAKSFFEQKKALPFPKDIRLDIQEQTDNYFLYWLLCGPFPIKNETGTIPDFLGEMGGELKALPIPGYSFKDKSDQSYSWIKYSSPIINQVDLKTVFTPNEQVVAYAYATIESEKERKVIATFGSNDGITVFCNEEQVYSIRSKRDVVPDEDQCILQLQRGKNHILLKIDNWKAGWGFSFRLKDVSTRNHKHKYKIVD